MRTLSILTGVRTPYDLCASDVRCCCGVANFFVFVLLDLFDIRCGRQKHAVRELGTYVRAREREMEFEMVSQSKGRS